MSRNDALSNVACELCLSEGEWIKPPRDELLGRLVAGDVFHARHPHGASLICMVTRTTENVIHARRLIVADEIAFDRQTGREKTEASAFAIIDSVAPLPIHIFNRILWLDRKNRLATDAASVTFAPSDRRALDFVVEHYENHQI